MKKGCFRPKIGYLYLFFGTYLRCTLRVSDVVRYATMNGLKHIGLLFCFLFVTDCVSAQGTIINSYAVALGYVPCTKVLTVDSVTGFNAGDKVLVIQMKGMAIDTSNTAAFGSTLSWNNLGNYEINEVLSVSGSTLLLKNELVRAYDYAYGKVQAVKIPYYSTYDVTTLHTAASDRFLLRTRKKPWGYERRGCF